LILSVLAVISPFAGRVIDRYDERLVGLPGIACYCGCFALFSQAGPGIGTWWAIWAALACAVPFASFIFWTTAIARRFDRHRGLALAIALCGTAVAAIVMPTLTHLLIDRYGWRGTYLRLGLGSALILLPLAFAALSVRVRHGATGGKPTSLNQGSWRELLASPQFIRIAFAGSVMGVTGTAIAIHFIPLMIEQGVSAETAAIAAGLTGVGAIIGRMITGYLLDRSRRPLIGALGFALPMIPCALLLGVAPGPALALAVGLLFGLSSGAEIDVLSYFSSRYFGVARYGAAFGAVFAIVGASNGFGPWLAGMSYDATGSYTFMLAVIIPLAALAALSLMTLGAYPVDPESNEAGA
jgi:predicted MFS family arabinose efflux permease